MTLDTMGIEFDDFAKAQLVKCEEFLVTKAHWDMLLIC